MAFLTKPGMLALLRNRLRQNDVILSVSSLLVVLRDLSAWFSIFDTAQIEMSIVTGGQSGNTSR